MFTDRTIISCDKNVATISVNLVNDGVNDTVISLTTTISAEIAKVVMNIIIKVQDNDGDQDYQKTIFSTSVDVEKLINGTRGSYLFSSLMENFYKSLEFIPSFPLKKVKQNYLVSLIFE